MNIRLTYYGMINKITAFIFFLVAFFLLISLSSHQSVDPSFTLVNNFSSPTLNYAGVPGAYCAAFSFYLFGVAAWLLIPLLLFISCFIYFEYSLHDEWERLVSFFLLIFSAAGFFGFYGSCFEGGQIGFILSSFCSRVIDSSLGLLLFTTLSFMNVMLIMRCNYIPVVKFLIKSIHQSYLFCVRYKVVSRALFGVNVSLRYLVWYPCRGAYLFLMHIWDGSAFEGTGLIIPEREAEIPTAFDFSLLEKLSNKKSIPRTQNQKKVDLLFNQTSYSLNQRGNEVEEESNSDEFLDDIEPQPAIPKKKSNYHLPDLSIFVGVDSLEQSEHFKQELEERAQILEEKLERFGVKGKVTSIKSGPVVTLFEYEPQIDTKLSKILSLEDDLALALQAMSIRIIAPIPGTSVVGFEVANQERMDVLFAKVIQSDEWKYFSGSLPLILGEDTVGNDVIVDLARMPHLLVAGSTGSGKSVALNAMLTSLLCKCTPDELQLILIDPKRLEFAAYADVAHLIFPIVTEPKRTIPILRWVVKEMESRYEKMATFGARSIADYNNLVSEKLPFIVVVIDELADLMMTAGRDVEDLITRIAQMARAAGIHMIVATQRPSVDVITGLIKVNFPSRISFRVTSKIDSRTILDATGADKLIGRGDMLFLDSSASSLKRVHGAYVENHEIKDVVDHICNEQVVSYKDIQQELADHDQLEQSEEEPLYEEVIGFLDEIDEVSISLLQRKFRIGYNRSARIIDMLESQGLIMPSESGKIRKVIKQ